MTLAAAAPHLNRPSLPPMVMVTDGQRVPDPVAAASHLPAGAGLVLRHYDDPARAILAQAIAGLARRRRLVLVVAADWRLAAAIGADGVHLPEGLARSGLLAPLLGWARRRGRIVTMACHSPAALAWAARLGIDHALLSPVFPTASHPGAATIGAVRFRLWARAVKIPVHALGGMSAERMRALPNAAGYAFVKQKGRPKPPFPCRQTPKD